VNPDIVSICADNMISSPDILLRMSQMLSITILVINETVNHRTRYRIRSLLMRRRRVSRWGHEHNARDQDESPEDLSPFLGEKGSRAKGC
jgi:hypothetical protein